MRILKRTSGMTLIELMLALMISGLIGAGGVAMMTASMGCFNVCTYQTLTDSDAVAAMQSIVADVREAKSIGIVDTDTLTVTPPVSKTDTFNGVTVSYYDRHTPATTGQISYYLSDTTGSQGATGTCLWKSISGGSQRILVRNVSSITFAPDTARSIEITITMLPSKEWNHKAKGPDQTSLMQRVVYLRNY